jgi:beta-lactamase regulating signal transducer with metallopeptidase domain
MSIYLSAETFTERLALTLVHFVWQGLVVTAVLIAVSGLLRPRRPASRYALNLFALVAMAACPVLTFLAIQPSFEQPRPAEAVLFGGDQSPVAATPKGTRATTTIVPAHVATEDPAVWRAWLPAAERWIVLGWIIGAALLGVRLLLGWVWLQRLKQRIERAPENLVAQAERLCRALHLRLPRVHVCRNVREAIAMGLIRPMILIPMSWLAELPPDMLEAVLAHELAHLRRWDLWANAFQRLVEALLFYHPAVWWVSRRMRIERELCCDELAVALTHDRLHYVQTLERVGRLVSFGKPADLAVSWEENV